jgi:hypothetical protein
LSLSFSCSFYFGFELFLTLLCHFAWFTSFRIFVGLATFFLFLDELLELFLAFYSSTYVSWDFRFGLQTLCFLLSMDSSSRRLRNQVVSILI